MKYNSTLSYKLAISFTILFFTLLLSNTANAQAIYQPYSYQFYQKFNRVQYSLETRQHTSIKPFIIDSVTRPVFDSLMNYGVKENQKWIGRKLFNEHLFQVENDEYTFYADFLPDFQIGRDFAGGGKTTWLNTRGYQIGATIGDKFSFYTSGYENQGVFPNYVNDFINTNRVVPGQMYGKIGKSTQDWTYVTANVSYTPIKYLNVSLAYDKNFIGDGYRSMLLSDVSSNYTNLKLTGNLGNVKYMSMWAYMLDPRAPRIGEGNRTNMASKWGAFQYLDWNATNRLSLGFFQSVIWANKTVDGTRGFDPSYLNPIVFLRPIESANQGSPDKMHLGLNAKYKVLSNVSVYGQFLLGEFTAKEFFSGNGYVHNKWAGQIGFRGYDAFKVKNLNFVAEYNLARPYTYSHFDPISNYSGYGQPLAHPLGANFKELVGIMNYSYKKFDLSLQANFAKYGLDPTPENNFGKDIFKSYNTYEEQYGNHIGQGLATDLMFVDGRVSYLINPKYNLRLEASAVLRQEKNDVGRNSSGMVMFGLRSSFRNLYYDF